MKSFLVLFLTSLSLNAFATVSVDKCSAGTLGQDNYITVTDAYDNYAFTFHETSFSIPVDVFKKSGNVLSVANLPVVMSGEGMTWASSVTIALIGDFSSSVQFIYSLDGQPLSSVSTSCQPVDVD